MNFQDIAWHKKGLQNMVSFAQSQVKEIETLKANNLKLVNDIIQYEAQIKRAELEGRESFDKDSYNKPRAKK